jgi:hypothetical protein
VDARTPVRSHSGCQFSHSTCQPTVFARFSLNLSARFAGAKRHWQPRGQRPAAMVIAVGGLSHRLSRRCRPDGTDNFSESEFAGIVSSNPSVSRSALTDWMRADSSRLLGELEVSAVQKEFKARHLDLHLPTASSGAHWGEDVHLALRFIHMLHGSSIYDHVRAPDDNLGVGPVDVVPPRKLG